MARAESMRPPEKRIALAADAFEYDLLMRLVDSSFGDTYVRAIKMSGAMLDDFHAGEQVRELSAAHKLEIIADAQLAGGYVDMVRRAARIQRTVAPTYITVAAGVTYDGIEELCKGMINIPNAAKLFLTGVMPEVKPEGFELDFDRDSLNYTTWRGEVAKMEGVQAAGIYGSSRYVGAHHWHELGLEYIGAGFSEDGEPYVNKDEITKVASTFEEGAATCDMMLIGNALAAARDPFGTADRLGDIINQTPFVTLRA